MAQKKISELALTKTINADDVFPIVQSGVTKQISYSDLKDPMVEEVTAAVENDIDNVRYDKYSNISSPTGVWNDGENNWIIERRIIPKKRLRNVYQPYMTGKLFDYIYIAKDDLPSKNTTNGVVTYNGSTLSGIDKDNNEISNYYYNVQFFLRATAITTNGFRYELQTLKTDIFSKSLKHWVFEGEIYDDIQYLIIESVRGN